MLVYLGGVLACSIDGLGFSFVVKYEATLRQTS